MLSVEIEDEATHPATVVLHPDCVFLAVDPQRTGKGRCHGGRRSMAETGTELERMLGIRGNR